MFLQPECWNFLYRQVITLFKWSSPATSMGSTATTVESPNLRFWYVLITSFFYCFTCWRDISAGLFIRRINGCTVWRQNEIVRSSSQVLVSQTCSRQIWQQFAINNRSSLYSATVTVDLCVRRFCIPSSIFCVVVGVETVSSTRAWFEMMLRCRPVF